jgi:hypothetical protein
VRAEGIEPSRAFAGPTDFHATSAFAAAIGVRGLDYPFTVRTQSGGGAARLVSTPSRPENRPSWLGSGSPLQGSPTLGSSASPVSRRALKFCLKSVASANSATPAWLTSDAVHDRATATSRADLISAFRHSVRSWQVLNHRRPSRTSPSPSIHRWRSSQPVPRCAGSTTPPDKRFGGMHASSNWEHRCR